MADYKNLEARIKVHEGFRNTVYLDTLKNKKSDINFFLRRITQHRSKFGSQILYRKEVDHF